MPRITTDVNKRFTGFRSRFKNLTAVQEVYERENLKKSLVEVLPAWEYVCNEPLVVDDAMKHLKPMDLLMQLLQSGELFMCLHQGELVGMGLLTQIVHERHAEFHAWIHPNFRGSFARQRIASAYVHEIFDYAFRPFGHTIADGLGLKKLKTEIPICNRSAGRAAMALGFIEVGRSPLDALYDGTPYDVILLEKLNPGFFAPASAEILPNARRLSESTSAASIHASASVLSAGVQHAAELPSTAGPASDNPKRVLSGPSDGRGSTSGSEVAELAPVEPESYVPRRVTAVPG